MSSTNRGGIRHIYDYYVTPVFEIEKMLSNLLKIYPLAKHALEGFVLDPAAGGDNKHKMSYPTAIISAGITPKKLHTWDIRGDSRAECTERNYLLHQVDSPYNVILTNPPFALAKEFIHKAIQEVIPAGGIVIMLLRLNFFGSAKRRIFWMLSPGMPTYTFVHSKRMSFTDDGKTDSIEYMHCVWIRNKDTVLQSTELFLI